MTLDSGTHKVFSYGGYSYIIWFDEIYAYAEDDEDEKEPHDQATETFEVKIEDVSEDDDREGDDDEAVLLPVAVEGPYTADDIKDFLANGDL
jgi:hypothetical protein